MLDTRGFARHAALPFKLTAIAALAASLSGCLNTGSKRAAALPAAPTTTTPTPTLDTVRAQIAAEPATTTTAATPVPANITQTLQLNGGDSRGLSVSVTYTENTSTGVLSNVGTPVVDTARVRVTPTSGAITGVTLDTFNARLTGSTSAWSAPGDQVVAHTNGQEISACAAGPCTATTLRELYLETWRPAAPVFQYLSYGDWYEQSAASGTAVQGVFGFLVVGQPTPPTAIPATGTATYAGVSGGLGIRDNGSTFDFEASFSATANFGARTVAVSTTNTRDTTNPTAPIAVPEHNATGTLTYSAGSNLFTGPIATTAASGITGTASGRFFGPAAQEMGGVFHGTGSGVVRRVGGVFAGKQ